MALKCNGRLLLLNRDPVSRVVSLPAKAGGVPDAVTGEILKQGNVALQPFEVRTLVLDGSTD